MKGLLFIGLISTIIRVAPDGSGDFISPIEAIESVKQMASSESPVEIFIEPGVYQYSSGYGQIKLYDGIHVQGANQDSVIIKGFGISASDIGDARASIANLTLIHRPTGITAMMNLGTDSFNVDYSFLNIRFISESAFAEPPNLVSAIRIHSIKASAINLLFENCSYKGKSIFLLAGHPLTGVRSTYLNVIFDHCVIESSPVGVGAPDPHFILQDWLPGQLTIRNCTIKWDMSQSTRGADMHRGAILMQNEDGNNYAGNQRLEILNSKIEMIDNGLGGPGKPASLICIAATANKNRCTVLLENTILRRGANVSYGVLTSNQSRVEYSQCNPLRPLILGQPATIVNLDEEPVINTVRKAYVGDRRIKSQALNYRGNPVYGAEQKVPQVIEEAEK